MTLETVHGGDGIPPEPDWASVYQDVLDQALAHEEWGIVLREMQEMQTIAMANGHAIKRLVMFRIQYERAARDVAENGPVVKAKKTRVPQYNPHWIVMRQADDAIRSLEGELGIAPLRRGRAGKATKKTKVARAADRYLRPVAKG